MFELVLYEGDKEISLGEYAERDAARQAALVYLIDDEDAELVVQETGQLCFDFGEEYETQ